MRYLTCMMLVAATALFSSAQPQCGVRGRVLSPSCVSYQAPVYRQAAHVQTYHEQVYVAPVRVTPDYYYSVYDYSRDRLLVDALAGRLLDLHKQGLFVAPGQPAISPVPEVPRKQYNRPKAMPSEDDLPPPEQSRLNPDEVVNPQLTKIVDASCIKCHQKATASNGNLSLADLRAVSEGQRWKAKAWVDSGEMPKGAKELPESVLPLFYEWASAASGKKSTKQ